MSHRVASLSHTADVGFRVESSTLEELFVGAAWGLVAALTDEDPTSMSGEERPVPAEVDPVGKERLEIGRPDRERLLVAWLREILHRALSQGKIPATIDVEIDPDGGLTGELSWCPPDRIPELVREIKGVTYHGLAVRETDEGWSARIVLDV